jgi:serine O-acetyltransferase
MHDAIIRQILRKQHTLERVPSNETIAGWAERLICLLYPEHAGECALADADKLRASLQQLEFELCRMLDDTRACSDCNRQGIAHAFFQGLPELYRLLNTDVQAILDGDPAAKSEFEVVRAYPGFTAMSFYRIAHALHRLDIPLIPRILTEHAHSKTGIDIHPAASIGEHFMIDHGTGVVIGETTVIGKHVKIYQGVTLGALSVDKSMASVKRHPTIEDHVILYSGATILGGDTVVGHHSIIGGNVWLTRSVPAGSLVFHNPEITVLEGKTLNHS